MELRERLPRGFFHGAREGGLAVKGKDLYGISSLTLFPWSSFSSSGLYSLCLKQKRNRKAGRGRRNILQNSQGRVGQALFLASISSWALLSRLLTLSSQKTLAPTPQGIANKHCEQAFSYLPLFKNPCKVTEAFFPVSSLLQLILYASQIRKQQSKFWEITYQIKLFPTGEMNTDHVTDEV